MSDKKKFYINGKWVLPKSNKSIKVINPATEDVCAEISLGSKEDVNDAVLSAKDAFKTWAFSSKKERLEPLEKLYELYKKRWSDIAGTITTEMGAPKDFQLNCKQELAQHILKLSLDILKNLTLRNL